MKKIIHHGPRWALMLGLGLLCSSLYSQTLVFESSYGGGSTELGYDLLETMDGGILTVGFTGTQTAGLDDFYILKTDSIGIEEWSITHGGFNNDIPAEVVELDDGSFVIVGWTGSFTSSPSRDIYLVKVSADGNIVWTHSIGGNGTDEATGIATTNDGGFIISALTESFGTGSRNVWLLRTDSMGDTLWTKNFGGMSIDYASDVAVAVDGGFIVTGTTQSFSNGSGEDVWLIKTDASGNLEWDQTYGAQDANDRGNSVIALADGYVVAGMYNNDIVQAEANTGEGYLLKTDLQGNVQWEQVYPSANRFMLNSVHQTVDSGFAICGQKIEFPDPAYYWVGKADDDGDLLWESGFGNLNSVGQAEAITQASNGDFISVGASGQTQSTQADLLMVRLSDTTLVDTTVIDTTPGTNGIPFTQLAKGSLAVYPNPTAGDATLSWDAGAVNVKEIIIRNASGQLMEQWQRFPGNNGRAELEFDQPGIYFVEARNGAGATLDIQRILVVGSAAP